MSNSNVNINVTTKVDQAKAKQASSVIARTFEVTKDKLNRIGTEAAKNEAKRWEEIRKAYLKGNISHEYAEQVAKTARKIIKNTRDAEAALKGLHGVSDKLGKSNSNLGQSFSKTVARPTLQTNQHEATRLDIKTDKRGRDVFEQLKNEFTIQQEAEEFVKAIDEIIAEAEKAGPATAVFVRNLKEIKSTVADKGLNNETFGRVANQIKGAAKECQRLNSDVRKKLAPGVSKLNESFQGMRPPSEAREAMDDLLDITQSLDGSVGGVSAQIIGWAKRIPIVGALLNKLPVMAILAGITAIAAAWKKMMFAAEEFTRINFSGGLEVIQARMKAIEGHHRNVIQKLERENQLFIAQRENARAIEDAIASITRSKMDATRSGSMIGALSDEERNNASLEYARASREQRAMEEKRVIDREKEDLTHENEEDEKKIKANNEKIGGYDAVLKQANQIFAAVNAQSTKGLGLDTSSGGFAGFFEGLSKRGQNLWRRMSNGDTLSTDDADELSREVKAVIQDIRDSRTEAIRSRDDARNSVMARNARLNSGEFEKRKEVVDAEMGAEKQNEDFEQWQRKRQNSMTNWQRKYELGEWNETETRAANAEVRRRKGKLMGYAGEMIGAQQELNEIEELDSQNEANFDAAKNAELERLKAKGGKYANITSLDEVAEEDLDDDYKQKRSAYEGKKRTYQGERRSAEGRVYDLKFQGDEQRAQLTKQSMQAGSRLAALGLGGGNGPAKETAQNTKSMLTRLIEISTTLKNGREVKGIGFEKSTTWKQ